LRVTHEIIEYIDPTGREQFVDLEECARNWVKQHKEHKRVFLKVVPSSKADTDASDAQRVGTRGAPDDPPIIEFMNERRTRFEFETEEALCAELLRRLGDAGWFTFGLAPNFETTSWDTNSIEWRIVSWGCREERSRVR